MASELTYQCAKCNKKVTLETTQIHSKPFEINWRHSVQVLEQHSKFLVSCRHNKVQNGIVYRCDSFYGEQQYAATIINEPFVGVERGL